MSETRTSGQQEVTKEELAKALRACVAAIQSGSINAAGADALEGALALLAKVHNERE